MMEGMTDEQPRPVANGDEHNYTLTVEETADRYAQSGFPRTHRAIQKYCAVSKLDCRKTETEFGEKYLVAPYSIDRHIAYIKAIKPMNDDANVREQPRTDANVPPPITVNEPRRTEAPNSDEQSRPVATTPDLTEKYIGRLEGEVTFLREELTTKNAQIKELTERSRETNVLIGGLQRLLAPMLGSPDPHPSKSDDAPRAEYGN